MNLLNKANTKKMILRIAGHHTKEDLQRFERVSADAIKFLEQRHMVAIQELVDEQRGKAITVSSRWCETSSIVKKYYKTVKMLKEFDFPDMKWD